MNSERRHQSGLFTPGIALLQEYFSDRLMVLKEATGRHGRGWRYALEYNRQVLRWRHGTTLCGGAMLSLLRMATEVPEGLGRLLDEDLVVFHRGRGDNSRGHRARPLGE